MSPPTVVVMIFFTNQQLCYNVTKQILVMPIAGMKSTVQTLVKCGQSAPPDRVRNCTGKPEGTYMQYWLLVMVYNVSNISGPEARFIVHSLKSSGLKWLHTRHTESEDHSSSL